MVVFQLLLQLYFLDYLLLKNANCTVQLIVILF
jgi:hypothetical protein